MMRNAAQRRYWTFYEAVKETNQKKAPGHEPFGFAGASEPWPDAPKLVRPSADSDRRRIFIGPGPNAQAS